MNPQLRFIAASAVLAASALARKADTTGHTATLSLVLAHKPE